jgi:CheY-like chemotaxis protein
MLSILLVDDDPAILEMLVQIAKRSRDIRISPARSAKEGLRLLSEQSFDVIITDFTMPEMDGIAFIRKLRSENDLTPVILYSDAQDDRGAAETLNSGGNYFLKKGRDPRMQFHEMVTIAQTVSGQSFLQRSVDTTSQVIADLINFSSDPSFAINRDGSVIAWNDSLEQLTNVPASTLIGKGDFIYAEAFHGKRRKILADLVFEPDDVIKNHNYMVISRVKNGPIIGVTRGIWPDGSGWTIWTKAMPVFDTFGNFLAVVATLRDVTATFGDIISHDTATDTHTLPAVPERAKPKRRGGKLIRKLLDTATAGYKEGVILMVHDKNYRAAIEAFDRALEIDNSLAFVWNDRGVCYRELGDHTNALKSCLRAVELAPESPQCLFTLGETLEKIGIMFMSIKYLDSAVQTFRMVVNQNTNNADAWSHMGVCYQEMGKTDEAKFHLDRARDIRLSGKDTPITYTRDDYV